jgi:hypothetical protein
MPRSFEMIVRNGEVEKAKAGDRCRFTGTLIVIPDVSRTGMPGLFLCLFVPSCLCLCFFSRFDYFEVKKESPLIMMPLFIHFFVLLLFLGPKSEGRKMNGKNGRTNTQTEEAREFAMARTLSYRLAFLVSHIETTNTQVK